MNKNFTEPYVVKDDEHFQKFMAKRSQNAWSVVVLSDFYFFKYSLTFPGTKERECLENDKAIVEKNTQPSKRTAARQGESY